MVGGWRLAVGGRRSEVGGRRSEERTEKVFVIARMFVSNIRKLDWSVKIIASNIVIHNRYCSETR